MLFWNAIPSPTLVVKYYYYYFHFSLFLQEWQVSCLYILIFLQVSSSCVCVILKSHYCSHLMMPKAISLMMTGQLSITKLGKIRINFYNCIPHSYYNYMCFIRSSQYTFFLKSKFDSKRFDLLIQLFILFFLNSILTHLETLKYEAAEVAKKVEETDEVMAEVETTSQQYVPLAQSCSSIYFTLEAMQQVCKRKIWDMYYNGLLHPLICAVWP